MSDHFEVVESYFYTKNGLPFARVDRLESEDGSKRFYPYLAVANGEFRDKPGLHKQHLPLYHEDEVLGAISKGRLVFLVEGERKCNALRARLKGRAAVTSMGSATAKEYDDNIAVFFGAVQVLVLVDADAPGREAGKRRGRLIAEADKSVVVKYIDLYPERNDGSDIHDWLDEGHKLTELRQLIDAAVRIEASKSIEWEGAYPKPILGLGALYGTPGKIIATILPHSECDAAALLANLLTSFGVLVGPGPFFLIESTRHHVNLFCLVVGESSWARKGTARGRIHHFFRLVTGLVDELRDISIGGLASGEGLIEVVADKLDKDGNVEAFTEKRLLVNESEFNRTLTVGKRDHSTLFDVLRQAFDDGNLRLPVRHRPLKANGAHIGMTGDITSAEINMNMPTISMLNGVLNRFAIWFAKRSKRLALGGDLRDEDLRPLAKDVNDALLKAKQVERMRFDAEAEAAYKAWYYALEEGQGLLGAALARGPAYVVRFAQLYALFDKSNIIGLRHLEAALAAWKYCADSAAFVFGSRYGDPDADKHLRLLQEAFPGGLTGQQVDVAFGKSLRAGKLDEIRKAQLRDRRIRCEREPSGEKGGRPTEIWFAVPPDKPDKPFEVPFDKDNPVNPAQADGHCNKASKIEQASSNGVSPDNPAKTITYDGPVAEEDDIVEEVL